jgi:hypothetical protein
MNRKAAYRAVEEVAEYTPEPALRTIRLTIEGLTPVYDHSTDKTVFELTGVTIANIDYPAIAQSLKEQGVPIDIAERAIEGFAEEIWASMLGREIAKRSRSF